MKDPLLHFQMERAMEPAFDKLRTEMMAFSERMREFDLDALLAEAEEPPTPPA